MVKKLTVDFIGGYRSNPNKYKLCLPCLRVIRVDVTVGPLTTLTLTDGIGNAMVVHLTNKMAVKVDKERNMVGKKIYITDWRSIEVSPNVKSMLVYDYMI